ncbi:hypothetical protein [Thalassobacillus pellis]|uniref:hypothetical protein n=1 Tax=Thalassobacillus pellis TaxID=748008 RepID=UPI0019602F9B|nr:hypothetical protein [Thalassobacillus pellis]MBM7552105.1 pyrroline-5-carboxylate reductase [Thalassobacillus pellis]
MTNIKVGLAGIGKLGSAMIKLWEKTNTPIGIYHPSRERITTFIDSHPNCFPIEIKECDYLFLAIPANCIYPFMTEILSYQEIPYDTIFINMATSLNTDELKKAYPDLNIQGLKFMGHAADLRTNGNGLFLSEEEFTKDFMKFFNPIGKIEKGSEGMVTHVNKLATYQAVKASIELEKAFKEQKLPDRYKERALSSLFPEVVKAYSKGQLGHFAEDILKELKD